MNGDEVERDNRRYTDESWSIIFFLANTTFFLFVIRRDVFYLIFGLRHNNYLQEFFEYLSSCQSSNYGNNTIINEMEFLKSSDRENFEYNEESFRININVLIDGSIQWGLWMSLFTVSVSTICYLLERFFNNLYVILRNYFWDAWCLIPTLYSTIVGQFVTAIMTMILLVAQSLMRDDNNLIVILSLCYLFFFYYYLTRMVIANYAIRSMRHERPFHTVLITAICHTLKYHIGTVCFNATVILPPLVALKCLMRKSNNLRDIHDYTKEKSSIQQFFRFLYTTIFIADHSTVITAVRGEDAFEAIDTVIYYVKKDLSVLKLRAVEIVCVLLAICLDLVLFAVVCWYLQLRIDEHFLMFVHGTYGDKATVFLFPLIWMVYGTLISTSNIADWFIIRQIPVAAG